MHPFKKFLLTSLLSTLALNPAFATDTSKQDEKLIFAIDLIRHGDRTPIADIPKAPIAWKEGLGSLTKTGAEQEAELGALLRKRYIDGLHLLPSHYDPSAILVRSTDSQRAIHSAKAFLSGLYPQNSQDTIPINSVEKKHDHLLIIKPTQNPFLLLALYAQNKWYWYQETSTLKNQLAHWRNVTGMPLNDFQSFDIFADNLYVRHLHHIPFPEGIQETEAEQIMRLGEAMFVKRFKLKEVTEPMGREFITTVAKQLQSATHNAKLKYVLYSAHDSTIMGVMNTLSNPLEHIPPYASHLNFSLYAKNNEYSVQVSLNDTPVTIPKCGGDRCTLRQFAQLI